MSETRTPGPLDADFAAGYVPIDCIEEWFEFERWKRAGGVAQPPLGLVPLDECGSFGVRVED